MNTIYIDVYFLINFTVDLLSLYLACTFMRVSAPIWRLVLSSAIGGLLSVIAVLLVEGIVAYAAVAFCTFALMMIFVARGIGIKRRIKLAFTFFIIETLMGGLVNYTYLLLDEYVRPYIQDASGSQTNRRMLIFAVVILLSIGFIKLFLALINKSTRARRVNVEIAFMQRSIRVECFVDTGNLLTDPMDKSAVMLLKPSAAISLLGCDIYADATLSSLPTQIKTRLRIIPITYKGAEDILYAIKPDCVYAYTDKSRERLSLTVAIDKEGGTFAQAEALVPSSVLDDL